MKDKSGSIRVVWFNQPYIVQNIKKDSLVRLSGKVNWDKKGIYISSPAYEMAKRAPTNTGRIVPVYPETRGSLPMDALENAASFSKNISREIPEVIPNAIA